MMVNFDNSRLNVVTLGDGKTEGSIQLPADSGKFAGLAMISPKLNDKDERVIITTGQTDGTVQVWKNPVGTHQGGELQNLVCPDNSPATAAASL